MSQGKAWKKDEVLEILEPYFKLGCNVTKACAYAGIPKSTVQTWLDNDEELRLKVTAWQNEASVQARKTWIRGLKKNSSDAQNWLTKKEKDEFAERKEVTGADGEKLIDPDVKKKSDNAVKSFLGLS